MRVLRRNVVDGHPACNHAQDEVDREPRPLEDRPATKYAWDANDSPVHDMLSIA